MHQPQQQQQQQPGIMSSVFQRLQQAAPGLSQQITGLMSSVGITTTTSAPPPPGYQHIPAGMPNQQYPGPVQQPHWHTYAQPGPGFPQGYAPPPQPQQQQQQQQPYHYHQQQQYYPPRPAPVTQVYPPPAAGGVSPAYPPPMHALGMHHPMQASQPRQLHSTVHYAPSPHGQQHQQQQQQQRREIPIMEATVNIKPSGLPVGGGAAGDCGSAAAGGRQQPVTPQPSHSLPGSVGAAVGAPLGVATQQQQQQQQQQNQQQQQQQDFHQLLQQLSVFAVPAELQGLAAAAVTGQWWYHSDSGWLSELTLMASGRFHWNRARTSSNTGWEAATAAGAAAAGNTASAAAAAASSTTTTGSQQQRLGSWHGIWRLQEGGTADRGSLTLVYITQQQQHHHDDVPAAGVVHHHHQQQQQQQQCVVTYQRSALDDTLVVDGLAHIKLGPA